MNLKVIAYFFICFFSSNIIAEVMSNSSFTTDSTIYVTTSNGASLETIQTTFKNLALINDKTQWIGGTSQLVNLGDFTGNTAEAVQISEYYISLQNQAEEAGGRFHIVLGDNEINLLRGMNTDYSANELFRKEQRLGKWLTALPFILKINDQLFAHGGISKWLSDSNLQIINKNLLSELSNQNKQQSLIRMEPSFYQGNSLCHSYLEEEQFSSKLKLWKTKRLWTGHSYSPSNRAQHRFNGQLQMLDTANINSSYAAKIDIDGTSTIINGLTGSPSSAKGTSERKIKNVYSMNDQQLENFLKTAQITEKKSTKEGRTKPFKVRLEKDGKVLHGIFKYRDSHPFSNKGSWQTKKNRADRYQYELAAYHLDRLLNIGLVPVTVERTIDGKKGVVQLWINGLISQLSFNEDAEIYSGFCDPKDQSNMMNAFDYLILNTDRNQTNILYSKDDWQVWFIDHSKSFGTSQRRPQILKGYDIKATKQFKKALNNLTKENLNLLRPWLHPRQIEAMLVRRDNLIAGDF